MDYVLLGFVIFNTLVVLGCMWLVRGVQRDLDRRDGYCTICGATELPDLARHIADRHMPSA